MNRALLLHTWRANRLRVAIVTVALLVWGTLLPIIFNAFASTTPFCKSMVLTNESDIRTNSSISPIFIA